MTYETARQLRQGSLQLNTEFISQIAGSLQLDPIDLITPLSDDQKREWNFYRISARQVTQVWRRVAEASTARNFSQQQLSELLDISKSVISRAIRGERKSPVLNWHDAAKIAKALDMPDGADTFIFGVFSREKDQNR